MWWRSAGDQIGEGHNRTLLLRLLFLKVVAVVVVVVVQPTLVSLLLGVDETNVVLVSGGAGFVVVEPGRDSLHFRVAFEELLDGRVLLLLVRTARLGRVVADDLRRDEPSNRRLRDDDRFVVEVVVGAVVDLTVVFVFFIIIVVVVVVVVVQDKA